MDHKKHWVDGITYCPWQRNFIKRYQKHTHVPSLFDRSLGAEIPRTFCDSKTFSAFLKYSVHKCYLV